MTRYYIPLRCPNCGETSISETQNPFIQIGDPMYMRHASVAKWGECNICNEIFPIPRNVREYHA